MFGIVYFNPISFGVFKPDLVNPIDTGGDGILFATNIFESHFFVQEAISENSERYNAKAEMMVLEVFFGLFCTLNKMHSDAVANGKPSVFVVVKGFSQGIKLNDIAVK